MFETERLSMRRLTPDDLDWLLRMRTDPEVSRYLGTIPPKPEAVNARLRFYIDCYERYGYGMSGVEDKESGALVGWGGLQPLEDSGETEVGYAFDKPFWGRGLATEVARAWLKYGFEHAGLSNIVAVAVRENTASTHVMEKLGMRFERESLHYGSMCDLYRIKREEFH